MTAQRAISKSPVSGATYTLAEMFGLDLRDSPALTIPVTGQRGNTCVQDSHVSEESLLAVDAIAGSRWTYRYETDEWIPIFVWAGTQEELAALVDLVPTLDPCGPNDRFWATFKAFPRAQ